MWYMIRHPQTILNQQGKYHGWGYAPYSDIGLKQFEVAVDYAPNICIDAIYSSDLGRCAMLAQEISRKHQLPLFLSESLRELNFGKWHGFTYDQLVEIYPEKVDAWVNNPWENAPIDGENLNALLARCKKFKEIHQNENALLITHGGVIAAFRYILSNVDFWRLLPHNSVCIAIDWKNNREKEIVIVK